MPFEKGVKNGGKRPGAGRPPGFKGLARRIADATDDGEELLRFTLRVFRNKRKKYTFEQQWAACKWLTERGFGLPMQSIELAAALDVQIGDRPQLDLTLLDRAQRANLREILKRAIGGPRDAAVTRDGRVLQIIDGGVAPEPDDDR